MQTKLILLVILHKNNKECFFKVYYANLSEVGKQNNANKALKKIGK
jgi:hypothetical protein